MEITEIKKTYITPGIELIVLDNEISLAMESVEDNDPMTDPNTPAWSKNNPDIIPYPFKNFG